MTAVHPTAFKQQVAKKKKKKKKKNLRNRSPPAYATLAGGLIQGIYIFLLLRTFGLSANNVIITQCRSAYMLH
jgi:hypothetical protein